MKQLSKEAILFCSETWRPACIPNESVIFFTLICISSYVLSDQSLGKLSHVFNSEFREPGCTYLKLFFEFLLFLFLLLPLVCFLSLPVEVLNHAEIPVLKYRDLLFFLVQLSRCKLRLFQSRRWLEATLLPCRLLIVHIFIHFQLHHGFGIVSYRSSLSNFLQSFFHLGEVCLLRLQ